jgi:hypothetical protein
MKGYGFRMMEAASRVAANVLNKQSRHPARSGLPVLEVRPGITSRLEREENVTQY